MYLLAGPTASGKSEVAVSLASMIEAEIISVDSMNVYRGMDIGTAKPSRELRGSIRHHLIDIISASQTFSVAAYLALAREAVEEIRARGRVPLFVGGTPLYVRALVSGIFEGPPADWDLRQRLYELAKTGEDGRQILHRALADVDPEAARRLHPHDMKRVVRAIEVHARAGRRISELQSQWRSGLSGEWKIFVLHRSREDLRARIFRRVEAMFEQGFVAEVRELLSSPGGTSGTARAAVGYAEVIEHIEQGTPLEEVRDRIKRRTWRVARKQMTWFRGFRDACWVEVSEDESPKKTAECLYKCVRSWHNHSAKTGDERENESHPQTSIAESRSDVGLR